MAGLLADVYSAIDTKKRQLKSLLDDPVETARQFINNQNTDAGKQLGLLSQAFTGADGKPTIGPQTPQARAAHDQLSEGMMSAVMGATVWHGSPHKFDKFDSSKIGTGEGAQAYGHGLYLADQQGIADGYRKTLSADGFLVGNKVFDPSKEIQHKNVKFWAGKGDLEGALMTAEKIAASDSPVANLAKSDLSRLREIQAAGGISRNEGALYKVDLPDEHIAKMLDWDKPLSQQHPDVQSSFMGIYDKAKQAFAKTDQPGMDWFGRGVEDMTVHQAYKSLSEDLIRSQITKRPSDVSGVLRDAGIPGIRYLDGGSRATGGTSNYVVFPGNEGLLSILERNGQAVK